VFPAASVALTWKLWLPMGRPLYACGLLHAVKATPSSEHWKVEPLSVEAKPKLALADVVGFDGLELIVVSGAIESTVHL